MQCEQIAEKPMMLSCVHLKRYWCCVVRFRCLVMLCCCCFTGLCHNQWCDMFWYVHCCSHKGDANGIEIKRLSRQLQGMNVYCDIFTNQLTWVKLVYK